MSESGIERSIWIGAPVERVWAAVTEPEQIPQWFLPAMPGSQMRRDDTGKLSLMMGEMGMDFAMFDQLEAPRRATSLSLPEKMLVTTYTFEPENDGTRLTVRMNGFEKLPTGAQQDRLNLSGAAWDAALENLKAYLDGRELPHPFASVAALYGHFRELKQQPAVERSVWIKATRERVWQAITDPAELEHWFSPGTEWQGTGLKVGGKLFVYDANTQVEMYVQVIDVVDPPSHLVTRSLPEPPETASYITDWTLTEENTGTRLTITHSGYEFAPAEARAQSMEQNTFGFGMMLANIKAHIEGTPLPMPGGF